MGTLPSTSLQSSSSATSGVTGATTFAPVTISNGLNLPKWLLPAALVVLTGGLAFFFLRKPKKS